MACSGVDVVDNGAEEHDLVKEALASTMGTGLRIKAADG